MKYISPKAHGITDYVTVLILALSPFLFSLSNIGKNLAFALAAVHLVLTLLTDFEPGIYKIIPLKIHGIIELLVSIALAAVAGLFYYEGDNPTSYFYSVFSLILFLLWAGSDYSPATKGSK